MSITYTTISDEITAAIAYMTAYSLSHISVIDWILYREGVKQRDMNNGAPETEDYPQAADWLAYINGGSLDPAIELVAVSAPLSDTDDLEHIHINSGITKLGTLSLSVTTGPAIPDPTGDVELFSVAEYDMPTITASAGTLPSGIPNSFDFADAAAPTNSELLSYTRILESRLGAAMSRQNELLGFCLELKAQIDRLSA